MSQKILIVGATGLIGRQVVEMLSCHADIDLHLLVRKETDLAGKGKTGHVARPDRWPEMIGKIAPDIFISALGTTWHKAGSEDAFIAVDKTLVVDCAMAAKQSGAYHAMTISSVGAGRHSRSFYLRTKGEMEHALAALGFSRLDILRPGLLVGTRGNDRRLKERLAILASPVTDALLHGQLRRYRSIPARIVAQAVVSLTQRDQRGEYVHENDAIRSLAE